MSESCPMFNEDLFLKAINNINQITNGKFESDLAICDGEMMGGRKMMGGMKMGSMKMMGGVRKGGTMKMMRGVRKGGKKMRGGFFNKGHVKTAIYAILAILAALSLSGEGTQVVIRGIQMIVNGECGYLSNRLWFQHPMCTYWNYLLSAVGKAIIGDPMAIAQLSGATIALVNTPGTVDAIVDRIAGSVSRSSPELTNGNSSNLQIEYGGKKSKKYGRKSKKHGGKSKMYGGKSRKSRK
jgi:hypothetical protein